MGCKIVVVVVEDRVDTDWMAMLRTLRDYRNHDAGFVCFL